MTNYESDIELLEVAILCLKKAQYYDTFGDNRIQKRGEDEKKQAINHIESAMVHILEE